jgi:hypothetical protein
LLLRWPGWTDKLLNFFFFEWLVLVRVPLLLLVSFLVGLRTYQHPGRRGEWSAARSGRTLPRERPGTHFTGGWVGPRAGLDRRKISPPTGIRSPERPARSQSLYRLSYPSHNLNRYHSLM